MKTRQEFIRDWCQLSGITEEKAQKYRTFLRCYCGDPICEGWASVPHDLVDWHLKTDGQPRQLQQFH